MSNKTVLAIASAGGHWHQLMQLRDAYAGNTVLYVTTLAGLPEQFDIASFKIIRDCNRNEKVNSLICAWQIFRLILRNRPNVIITTGALPGFIALVFGKLFRAHTIWVDSVANGEEMSMSGQKAKTFADEWITQWEHVAHLTGARFKGSVL